MVFGDKTKINRFDAHGKSWCWINDKENIPNHIVKQTMKHDRRSVMLWICMTIGLGDLEKVKGHINTKDYVTFLHGDLNLSLESLGYFNFDKVIFQYDNASIYEMKIV